LLVISGPPDQPVFPAVILYTAGAGGTFRTPGATPFFPYKTFVENPSRRGENSCGKQCICKTHFNPDFPLGDFAQCS
jgi:hypothetical protein